MLQLCFKTLFYDYIIRSFGLPPYPLKGSTYAKKMDMIYPSAKTEHFTTCFLQFVTIKT